MRRVRRRGRRGGGVVGVGADEGGELGRDIVG